VLLWGAFLGLVGLLELLAELPLLEDFSFLTTGLLEGLLEEPLVWGRLGPLRLWARARHRAPDRAIGTFLAGALGRALGRALAGALCRAPARTLLEFLGNAPAASLADVDFGGLFGSRGWLLGRRFFGRRLLLRSCLFSGRLLLRCCLLLWSSFLLLYPAAPGHIIFDHIYLVVVDILFRTKIARGSHVAGVGWYCPVGGWWC
jgi:hypothetical protein